MKIIRDEEKKEKTPEEKQLEAYKKARLIGLGSLGVGTASVLLSRLSKNATSEDKDTGRPKYESYPNSDNTKPNIKRAKYGGLILGGLGLGLHGISAVKYRQLKKKLEKEKKEDDNKNKEKD